MTRQVVRGTNEVLVYMKTIKELMGFEQVNLTYTGEGTKIICQAMELDIEQNN